MPNSVYWDACLFIEVLQKTNPARLDACRDLIDKAEKKALVIVTSALTITEVNKFGDEKVSGLSREEQSKFILAFLGNAYIKVRPLDRQTAEFAHHLTRQHSLKNMDAIHAATAVIAKADVL
jgi:predicted nucleic acid-binding protein